MNIRLNAIVARNDLLSANAALSAEDNDTINVKKPTIKTHYEKIDGKMIQTAAYIEDNKDTTQQSTNPRYQVKKTLDKAFLEQFKNKKI